MRRPVRKWILVRHAIVATKTLWIVGFSPVIIKIQISILNAFVMNLIELNLELHSQMVVKCLVTNLHVYRL